MTLDFSPLLEIEVLTGGVTIGHAPTVAEPGPLRFVLASFNLFSSSLRLPRSHLPSGDPLF